MLLDSVLDSPDAPLEQAYLTYKIGWLARRRLGIPPQPSPRINIWGPNFNKRFYEEWDIYLAYAETHPGSNGYTQHMLLA